MSDRLSDLDLGGSFALGPWRVRPAGYGAMQLASAVSSGRRGIATKPCVLRAAVDLGVNHIDTAQYYRAQ